MPLHISECSAFSWAVPVVDARLNGRTPAQVFALQNSVSKLAWLDRANSSNSWSYLASNPLRQHDIRDCARISWSAMIRDIGRDQPIQRLNANGPPFRGGWIGFIAYDAACETRTQGSNPISRFSFFDIVLAYDHSSRQWWCAGLSLEDTAPEKMTTLLAYKVATAVEQIAPAHNATKVGGNCSTPVASMSTSNFTRDLYCHVVEQTLEYIRNGHIYQLNLAQRFTVPANRSPQSLYLALRAESPAAFGTFLGSGLVGAGQSICSVSPELFLKVHGRGVTTRPIKGTRPLGCDETHTAAAARELDSNAKERAELTMIVDLERNDLGRVCEYGSVRVENAGSVERLPTLLHRVATVSGVLRRGCGPAQLLRAAFPGGSITGAPKHRAMELIGELEPDPRGIYCGAIGWIAPDGDMELSIAIRTAIHDSQRGVIGYASGSGIVADSDPAMEYEETLLKAKAFFRAVNATLIK